MANWHKIHYIAWLCVSNLVFKDNMSHIMDPGLYGLWRDGRTCRIITVYRFLLARLSANTTFISVNIKHIHVSNGIIPCYRCNCFTWNLRLLPKHFSYQNINYKIWGHSLRAFFSTSSEQKSHTLQRVHWDKTSPPQAFPWCLAAKQDGESVLNMWTSLTIQNWASIACKL